MHCTCYWRSTRHTAAPTTAAAFGMLAAPGTAAPPGMDAAPGILTAPGGTAALATA